MLFSDDFSGGTYSNQWVLATSGWTVVGGEFVSPLNGRAYIPLSDVDDYVLEAMVRIPTVGDGPRRVGLRFRADGETSFYEVELWAGGSVQLYKYQPRTFLSGASVNLTPGTQYLIQVVAEGNQITVYVDGVLVISYADPSPLTGGNSVWLNVQDNAVGQFDDVVVRVPNTAPVAVAVALDDDGMMTDTVKAGAAGYAEVILDGSGSYDPDGDALVYNWHCLTHDYDLDTEGLVLDEDGTGKILLVEHIGINFDLLENGFHEIELTVSDGKSSDTATMNLNVLRHRDRGQHKSEGKEGTIGPVGHH